MAGARGTRHLPLVGVLVTGPVACNKVLVMFYLCALYEVPGDLMWQPPVVHHHFRPCFLPVPKLVLRALVQQKKLYQKSGPKGEHWGVGGRLDNIADGVSRQDWKDRYASLELVGSTNGNKRVELREYQP